MTLSVSNVEGWQPEGLDTQSASYDITVDATDANIRAMVDSHSRVAPSWHGDAAGAAASRIFREQGLASSVSAAIHQLSEASKSASGITAAAKAHLTDVVSGARGAGFEVADPGQVTANAKMAVLETVGGPGAAVAMLELQREALHWTTAVLGALSE